MQWIYSENPPPFHLHNLAKLDACSEPQGGPFCDSNLYSGNMVHKWFEIRLLKAFGYSTLEKQ